MYPMQNPNMTYNPNPSYAAYQYNPMMRFQQPQEMPQPQQTMQQPMNVLGKIVDSVEMVRSMDVPMDGGMYFFPKADGTEIFAKQWIVNEGRTRILAYKPILEDNDSNSTNAEEKLQIGLSDDATKAIMSRFDELSDKIGQLINGEPAKNTTKSARTKSSSNLVQD